MRERLRDLESVFSIHTSYGNLRHMSRTAQIACVVIFIVVMVAIHQGAKSVMTFMGGDFAFGFAIGGMAVFGLVLIIQKLEAGKASRSIEPTVQKKRSRDFLDL